MLQETDEEAAAAAAAAAVNHGLDQSQHYAGYEGYELEADPGIVIFDSLEPYITRQHDQRNTSVAKGVDDIVPNLQLCKEVAYDSSGRDSTVSEVVKCAVDEFGCSGLSGGAEPDRAKSDKAAELPHMMDRQVSKRKREDGDVVSCKRTRTGNGWQWSTICYHAVLTTYRAVLIVWLACDLMSGWQ